MTGRLFGRLFAGQSATGLRHWWLWLAVGVAMTLVVVYLSLADVHLPQVPSTIGDKINHLIAYGVLTGWFGQLYLQRQSRIVIAICLALLGVLMEVLQGITSYRFFDLLDACANILGVLIGLLALRFGADKILLQFENRYLKVS